MDRLSNLVSKIAGGPVQGVDAAEQDKLNTPEENAHLLLAKDRFEMARAGKQREGIGDLNTHWKNMKRIYEGDMWEGSAPAYKSRPVLPYAFSLVEAVVPRLVDTSPAIKVLPRSDINDMQLAKELSVAQDSVWYINEMDRQMAQVVRQMLKYGTTFIKVYWDEEFHQGVLGDVRFEVVHPQNFFNDPRAYEIDKMEFCFIAVPKPLSWFRRMFPKKGKYVTADDVTYLTNDDYSNQQSRDDRGAMLYEYWFRNADGDIGRMYYSGNVVLDLVDGPFYKHNMFPVVKIDDYELDKEFWSIGEIELIASLNKLVNSYEAQIIDNTRLMANVQWVVDKVRSGIREIDTSKINNRPGAVIMVNDINAIRKEPGMPVPAHVPAHQQQLIFTMEQILGIHDVVQGRKPSGVRAASAIIALQEAANLRVREKARNITRSLTRLGKLTNWLILEFYDEERRFRQFEGDLASVVTLNVREALQERAVRVANEIGELPEGIAPGTPMQAMPDQMVEELTERIAYPEFDVEVKVGPAVPYSQALLYEQAKEFFQLGAIDRRALLEATNFPGYEEILARIEGREAAQMEAERVGEMSEQQLMMAAQQQQQGQQPEMPLGLGAELLGKMTSRR